jgi:hypothetical protein
MLAMADVCDRVAAQPTHGTDVSEAGAVVRLMTRSDVVGFVIYYRDGRVPQPGIILLGRVTDDVSIFDRPGPVTIRIERIK